MKPFVRRILITIALPCLAALLLTSCATVDAVTGQNVYNMYTVDDDIKLGQEAMTANLAELEKQGTRIDADPVEVAKLNEIMQKLVAVSDMPQLPYKVTLIHTNIVNACAMPGGQMIVFQGLYDGKDALVKDDDELAAVMAHEIAHVNCRHTTEEMSKIMAAAAIMEIVAAVAEHNDENDWATAIRAAPRIWQRVYQKEQEDPGVLDKAMSIFGTHPSDKSRFKDLSKMVPYAMEEYAKAVGSYPKGYNPAENPEAVGQEFNWRVPQTK